MYRATIYFDKRCRNIAAFGRYPTLTEARRFVLGWKQVRKASGVPAVFSRIVRS